MTEAEVQNMIKEKENQVVVVEPKTEQMVQSAILKAGENAMSLKEVIDYGVTGKALQDNSVMNILTAQKQQELKEDATAKVIKAEAERISKETERTSSEKQKLIEETEKAKAYYNAHKSVLKYSFVNEPMSIPYMRVGAVIGTVIMCLLNILFSPIIIAGKLIELIIGIIGGVTGAITQNALKLIVGLLVTLFIVAVGVGCYIGLPMLLK